MEDDSRGEAQFDPKNTRPGNAKRIRWSFVVIVLIFIALAVTAMLIATKSQ